MYNVWAVVRFKHHINIHYNSFFLFGIVCSSHLLYERKREQNLISLCTYLDMKKKSIFDTILFKMKEKVNPCFFFLNFIVGKNHINIVIN